MKKLEILPVDQLQPGMLLAADLADEGGRVLLPAGAELSVASIAGLKRRGIETASVELEVEEDAAELEKYRRQALARLDRLFRHAGEGSETRALYEVVARYRMERRS